MDDEVLAMINASPARSLFGIVTMALLGLLLLYLAFVFPAEKAIWQIFLIGLGLIALFMANKMRRASGVVVELTKEGLRDNRGDIIVTLDNIRSVERGVFAMKPSNGFLLRTHRHASRRWNPGIWWRVGRSIGIGGITPAAQIKTMVQMLDALRAETTAD